MDPVNDAGTPAAHWGRLDPESTTPREFVAGLPRLITETRGRLGLDAPAEKVLAELQQRGLDVTLDDVQKAWDRGA